MPYEPAGPNRPPHSLGELPTNAEITAMVNCGRRLQAKVCWDAVLGILKQTASKPVVQPIEQMEQPPLIWSMLKQLGFDEALLLRDDFIIRLDKMTERCVTCAKTDACKSWLESGRPNNAYQNFCANASAFDALPRKVWVV